MESSSHVSEIQCNYDDDGFQCIFGDERNDKLAIKAHPTVVSAMKSDKNAVEVAVNNQVPVQSSFSIVSQSLTGT